MAEEKFLSLRRLGYVRGLRAFLTLDDLELDFVAFLETFVALAADSAVMNKYIRAIVSADKTVAFRVIEPLDGSFQSIHLRPPG
jgi:hypothetical protein